VKTVSNIDFDHYLRVSQEAAHVRPAGHWRDDVVARFLDGAKHFGARLPWGLVSDRVRIRPGEVSIWAGVNGHGKSQMLSQVVLHLLGQGQRACIASMEMLPVMTMYRMTRQAMGPLMASEGRIRDFHAWLDEDRLWLYDQQGTVKSDRIIALGRFAASELAVQHLVVDSLMKCGVGVDDYNRQKSFIDELTALARDTGLHVHLVAHSRKGRSEDDVIGKFDIKGASEITDQVDNVFTIWRNKPKERAAAENDPSRSGEPDALLTCDKQRHGEWEGQIKLWFRPRSLQYTLRDCQEAPWPGYGVDEEER
jgi:twinkle protein